MIIYAAAVNQIADAIAQRLAAVEADGRSDSNDGLDSAFFEFLNEPQPNDVSAQEWNKMRLQVAFIAGAKAEREACAKVCDGKADDDYEAKAKAKTYDANLSKDDELRRLRHWQDVHLVNAALKRAAAAIRMRSNVKVSGPPLQNRSKTDE